MIYRSKSISSIFNTEMNNLLIPAALFLASILAAFQVAAADWAQRLPVLEGLRGECGSAAGSGQGVHLPQGFSIYIIVPFCSGKTLSGAGHTDFIDAMCNHRKLSVPREWDGKKLHLNIGGVDYRAGRFPDGSSLSLRSGGKGLPADDIASAADQAAATGPVVYEENGVCLWQRRHPPKQQRSKT